MVSTYLSIFMSCLFPSHLYFNQIGPTSTPSPITEDGSSCRIITHDYPWKTFCTPVCKYPSYPHIPISYLSSSPMQSFSIASFHLKHMYFVILSTLFFPMIIPSWKSLLNIFNYSFLCLVPSFHNLFLIFEHRKSHSKACILPITLLLLHTHIFLPHIWIVWTNPWQTNATLAPSYSYFSWFSSELQLLSCLLEFLSVFQSPFHKFH